MIKSKKMQIAVLLLALCIAVMSSCKSNEKKLFDTALEIYSASCAGSPGYYIKSAEEGETGYISDERLCELYLKNADCKELSYICDYCILYSRKNSVCEVHILRAGTKSQCQELGKMLELRAGLLIKGEYIPEGSEGFEKAKEARVITKGCCAYLIAGKNVAEMAKAID